MAIYVNGKFEVCTTMLVDDYSICLFPLSRMEEHSLLKDVELPKRIKNTPSKYEFCMIFERTDLLYEGVWDGETCIFGVKYDPCGDYYIGDLENFQQHGQGCFYGIDGFIQRGQWKHNVLDGESYIQYPNGKIFRGTWNEETQSGEGTSTWPDGDVYEGAYKNGKRNGRGYYKNHLGESYLGEWTNGYCHGNGESYDKDGNFYRGEWQYNLMDGKGEYEYKDGRSYVGSFQNDLKNGYGIYKWTDGDIYKGTWKNGKRDGKGIKIKGNVAKETYFVNNRKVSEKVVPLRGRSSKRLNR